MSQGEALDTLRQALDQRQPSDTFDFTRYDLLAEAPNPPQGLIEMRRMLVEAADNKKK